MFNREKIKELEYQVASLTREAGYMRENWRETSKKLYALANALGYEWQELPAKVTFVKKEQDNWSDKTTFHGKAIKKGGSNCL